MVDALAAAALQLRRHPDVASRHPLWEDRAGRSQTSDALDREGLLLDHGRETIGTRALDAEPGRDPAKCRATRLAPFVPR